MLAHATAPALRWRQMEPEALVLGYRQPESAADPVACRAAGVRVYRRTSGGTAVLSGRDLLAVDIVLPAGHRLALSNVTESYRWLGEALAAGLRSLGIAADAVSPAEARVQARSIAQDDPLRLACYALLSPYEVVVGGRKLIGLAQVRRRSGSLLQAGLLLRWNAERLAGLLTIPAGQRERVAHMLHDRAIGLDEIGLGLDDEELIAHLTVAIGAAGGAELAPEEWNDEERASYERARPGLGPIV